MINVQELAEMPPIRYTIHRKMSRANSSGHTGIYYNREARKWRARIRLHGRNKHLGYYQYLDDAIRARRKAEMGFAPIKDLFE